MEEQHPINILPVAHRGSMLPLRTEKQPPPDLKLLLLFSGTEEQDRAAVSKFLVLRLAPLLLSRMEEQRINKLQAARMLMLRSQREQDLINIVPLQRQLALRASLRATALLQKSHPNRRSRKTNLTQIALLRLRRACRQEKPSSHHVTIAPRSPCVEEVVRTRVTHRVTDVTVIWFIRECSGLSSISANLIFEASLT